MLGGLFGINGVWLAFPVGSAVLIAAIVIIAMVRKRSIKIGPDDILGLRTDFGATSENTLWYNITSENPTYTIDAEDISHSAKSTASTTKRPTEPRSASKRWS